MPFQLSKQKLKICVLEEKPVPQFETPKPVKLTTKQQFLSVGQNNVITGNNTFVSDSNLRGIIFVLSSYTTSYIFIHCLGETCFRNLIPCFCSQFTAHPKISWSILPSSAASACSPIRLTSGSVKSSICCPRICRKTQYIHVSITTQIHTHTFQNTNMIQNEQEQFTHTLT